MLLTRLKEYEDDREHGGLLDDRPAGYEPRSVPWLISLSNDGQPHFIRTSGGRGKKDTGKSYAVPYLKKTSATRPLLLVGSAEYVLGLADPIKPERAGVRHAAFKALTTVCAKETNEATVVAVLRFLNGLQGRVGFPDDMAPSDVVMFEVGGVFPTKVDAVQDFWIKCMPYLESKSADVGSVDAIAHGLREERGEDIGTCLVCGRNKPIARIHRLAIRLPKSVADQQVSVVSANEKAFSSYGLEQSKVGPTCSGCAESYARAINRLVDEPGSNIVIGSVIYIFWTKDPQAALPFAALLNEADPALVKDLYESVYSGRLGATKLDEMPFYATALSGSGGRAVVRDWIDTTVGRAKEQVARWFQLQRITAGKDDAPYLGLRQLAYATIRTGDRRNPPAANVSRSLLRTALLGTPLPWNLLAAAVRRCQAEQSVSSRRAALIKMVLLSQQQDPYKEDAMVTVNEAQKSSGYLCGRLLFLLEKAQRDATPGELNATIVDRFYGTASSAPASVFGRLMRGAQPHLSKLAGQPRGKWLQRRIGEVAGELNTFPRTLTLQEQGLFALGYYHERQASFVGKGAAPGPDTDAHAPDGSIDDTGADAPTSEED